MVSGAHKPDSLASCARSRAVRDFVLTDRQTDRRQAGREGGREGLIGPEEHLKLSSSTLTQTHAHMHTHIYT